MRALALSLFSAVGLAASVAAAAPIAIPAAPTQASDIVKVSGGCGWGLHRRHGYCVPSHRNRPYAYRRHHRYYGNYRPRPYYGGGYGYQQWNRPSPGDHVANQLNAQQLGRGGY